MRIKPSIVFCAIWTLLLSGCSSGSPTPTGPGGGGGPTLSRVATPVLVDTVDAEPATAWVLRVAEAEGTPIVGTMVAFTGSNLRVAAPGGVFAPTASGVTDSRGEVAVMLRFGSVAGAGSVVATVATAGLADTLPISVTAGATAIVALSPADTTVVVGSVFELSTKASDRHGNPTNGNVSLRVDSGPISASGSGFVGTRFGLGQIVAELPGATGTATIRVVPEGEIVYTRQGEAWLAHFDGSGAEPLAFTVPPAQEPSVSWNPAGSRIVLGGSMGFVVFDLETQSVLPSAWPGGLAGSNILWPRFGPGGKIYYSSADGSGAWDIRVMNPDGTDPAILIPSARFPYNDFFPDWAPDGSRFAFTADWEERNRFLLRLSDPTATTITTVNIEGTTHVWSPDGSLIAFQELGRVGVVAPDQSVQRNWNLGWSKGVTWSPGSDMLVGIRGGQIAIADATTGESLVLGSFGTDIQAVAWRPR